MRTLQERSLRAATGKEALKLHTDAAQMLSLFPMAEEDEVISKAREMVVHQSELLVRIEVLRRQRYNLWAAKRIEQALNSFHKKTDYVDTKGENKELMNSLVNYMAEVDPSLLEPAAMDLYRYVLDLTKNRISGPQKAELAKALVTPNPEKPRMTLGNF